MGRGRGWSIAVQYGVVLFLTITANFALPRLAPGDPLEFVIGPEVNALTTEQRSQLEEELGLHDSVFRQYLRYLGGIATGDLGMSVRYGRPVTTILFERIPWTLALSLPALALGAVLSIWIGAAAAWRRGTTSDITSVAGILLVDSLPAFWIAMVLVGVFSVHLGWLPSFGAAPLVPVSGPVEYAWEVTRRLILPVTSLTLAGLGHLMLLTRGAIVTTLGEDFVFMARAKGLGDRTVVRRYVLRNALLPVLTNIALGLGGVLGGAVLVETVFAYPGLGRVIFEAVGSRDYPMLQGAFLLVTVTLVSANALADFIYPRLDPRVRSGHHA